MESLDDAGLIKTSSVKGFEDLNKNVQDLLIVSKMEGNHSRLSDFPFNCGFHFTRAALRENFIYLCFWALKPYIFFSQKAYAF